MSLPLTQSSQLELGITEASDVNSPIERMEWNDAFLESLLYQYGSCFKGSKSKAQLAAALYRILTDFNSENHRGCKVDQLKKQVPVSQNYLQQY